MKISNSEDFKELLCYTYEENDLEIIRKDKSSQAVNKVVLKHGNFNSTIYKDNIYFFKRNDEQLIVNVENEFYTSNYDTLTIDNRLELITIHITREI